MTRCGVVALIGLPNAGKSTLLNALLGERLSIVTAKAQTTRKPVTGIRSEDGVQVIFRDTPGLLRAENRLQHSMREMAQTAAHDADAVVLIVDASRPPKDNQRQRIEDTLTDVRSPILAVLNKSDVSSPESLEAVREWIEDRLGAETLVAAAAKGSGVDAVWTWIGSQMPESPFLHDEEDLSTDNLRFFVAELVRETVFEMYRQEIPYSVVCTVDAYRENEDPVFIRVVVNVERNSQKGIVIGKRGAGIRELGTRARQKIETLLGQPVYLDLWVKVLDGWRSRDSTLKQLGFPVPDTDQPRQ